MNILLPTDTFPPGQVGGAAWSTHALAHALHERGHTPMVVVASEVGPDRRDKAGTWHHEYATGVPALRYGYMAPSVPFLKNYYRHEKLTRPLATLLTQQGAAYPYPLVIHAQHVQTTPPAILAGRQLGVPVLVTVRDHWPWHYFATGLHGNLIPHEPPDHPGARSASLITDLVARLGPLAGLAALPAVPYMLAHQRRRAAFLAQADMVIAVSSYIARRLEQILPPDRITVIPNMVNIAQIEETAKAPLQSSLPEAFMLFVGKLEPNKGAQLLPEIVRMLPERQALPPLVVVGSGSLQPGLERDLAVLGVRTIFLSWASHDDVLRLMARCQVLLFPSLWSEPLSRVLLEACAVGCAVVAMPTGGTPDIITHGVDGILAATPLQFAHWLHHLLTHPAERHRLSCSARTMAYTRFRAEMVIPQVEHVYAETLARMYRRSQGGRAAQRE
jgi:glycosyltransferase involved in cell wall biosynthesis